MKQYAVVRVSYDYFRFENYLGIYSRAGLSNLDPTMPWFSVDKSKKLADEKLAIEELGENRTHYMIEEIINE